MNDLIDKIFEVNMDEVRIENILSRFASDLMLIDQKKPDFSSIQLDSQTPEDEVLLYTQPRDKQDSVEKSDLPSEMMTAFYFPKDDHLWCKEIDGDTIEELKIMPLKLYLQKIVTVPFEGTNKVFLFGGSKDPEGKETVDN